MHKHYNEVRDHIRAMVQMNGERLFGKTRHGFGCVG